MVFGGEYVENDAHVFFGYGYRVVVEFDVADGGAGFGPGDYEGVG